MPQFIETRIPTDNDNSAGSRFSGDVITAWEALFEHEVEHLYLEAESVDGDPVEANYYREAEVGVRIGDMRKIAFQGGGLTLSRYTNLNHQTGTAERLTRIYGLEVPLLPIIGQIEYQRVTPNARLTGMFGFQSPDEASGVLATASLDIDYDELLTEDSEVCGDFATSIGAISLWPKLIYGRNQGQRGETSIEIATMLRDSGKLDLYEALQQLAASEG